jgi:hypothetical protein
MLDSKLNNRTIAVAHYRKLINILNQFKPEPVVVKNRTEPEEVSDDVSWAFSNWRNSKTNI